MPLDINRVIPQVIANIENHYKDPLGYAPLTLFDLDSQSLCHTWGSGHCVDGDLLIRTSNKDSYKAVQKEMGPYPKRPSETLDLVAHLFNHVKGQDLPTFDKTRSDKLFTDLEDFASALLSHHDNQVEVWLAQLKAKFTCCQ